MQIGATDVGTGCDTILCQIAAEELGFDPDAIVVRGVDTDVSRSTRAPVRPRHLPHPGMAAKRAAQLRERSAPRPPLVGPRARAGRLDGERHVCEAGEDGEPVEGRSRPAACSMCAPSPTNARRRRGGIASPAHAGGESPVSPPPFMAGIAEGSRSRRRPARSASWTTSGVVDCGTIVNSALARACKPRAALRGGHRHGAHRGGVLQRGGPFTRPFVHDVPPAHAPGHPAYPRGVRAELRADGRLAPSHRRGRHQHAGARHRELLGLCHRRVRARPAHHAWRRCSSPPNPESWSTRGVCKAEGEGGNVEKTAPRGLIFIPT